jgi:putative cell wall-binding protein
VVVTSGLNFADALTGAYLAIGKDAPILLIDNRAKAFEENRQMITGYITENLVEGGTVYILGGENAVPAGMDAGLTGYNVVRLAGENRYATNLAILAETGLGNRELLICSAKNFADSVSAAAAGRPILMVGSKLTQEQKDFLAGIKNDMVIIGGPAAVSEAVEAELAEYGNVTRIGGANRFETSVMIAENLFTKSAGAVLAYAKTFPDALCSGPLAYRLNAPILLTQSGNTVANAALTGKVTFGRVVGGPKLINDDTVRTIFGLSGDTVIYKK